MKVIRASRKLGISGAASPHCPAFPSAHAPPPAPFLMHIVTLTTHALRITAYLAMIDGGNVPGFVERLPMVLEDPAGIIVDQHSVVAAVLLVFGQILQLSVYARLGIEGVYYGNKLGCPVPWVTGWPFNMQLRHPQYIGCVMSYIALFRLLTPEGSEAQLMLAIWGTITSYIASGEVEWDEDGHLSPTPEPTAAAAASAKPPAGKASPARPARRRSSSRSRK